MGISQYDYEFVKSGRYPRKAGFGLNEHDEKHIS